MMTKPVVAPKPAGRRWLAGMNLRRVTVALLIGVVGAAALNPIFMTPFVELLGRALVLSLLLTLAFTAAGKWRQNAVPVWLAQVLAVALAAPVVTFAIYLVSVRGDLAEFLGNEHRLSGFLWIAGTALLAGLVLSLGALLREREAQSHAQALQFALERSTLERQALDARLRVLHAQIEPHFLFNTLANVQALVELGSPRAAPVLASLIAYLRASMAQLRSSEATLGAELSLVRSYLEVMQLRMPDRLQTATSVPEALQAQRFPPMALLTLVENAVRHGIDPSEEGGRIEIGARADGPRVHVWVADTGRGLDPAAPLGTGLANLRQRLEAFYGPGTQLHLGEGEGGRGVRAEIVIEPKDGA